MHFLGLEPVGFAWSDQQILHNYKKGTYDDFSKAETELV